MSPWIPEQIPDPGRLFMRLHEIYYRDGEVNPGVFRDHGFGMSTDWEKYSTPAETRNRGREPAKNAVISLVAGRLRKEASLVVRHKPDEATKNRAHTEVIGPKTPRIRVLLLRIFRWELPFAGRNGQIS
jgi:hypothetical protein